MNDKQKTEEDEIVIAKDLPLVNTHKPPYPIPEADETEKEGEIKNE